VRRAGRSSKAACTQQTPCGGHKLTQLHGIRSYSVLPVAAATTACVVALPPFRAIQPERRAMLPQLCVLLLPCSPFFIPTIHKRLPTKWIPPVALTGLVHVLRRGILQAQAAVVVALCAGAMMTHPACALFPKRHDFDGIPRELPPRTKDNQRFAASFPGSHVHTPRSMLVRRCVVVCGVVSCVKIVNG